MALIPLVVLKKTVRLPADLYQQAMIKPYRAKIHEIIFEADTRAGKLFDVFLMIAIIISVAVVMLDSVDFYRKNNHELFLRIEYLFTALFTIEYLLRIYSIKKPKNYIFSFFGIIDLLSVLPTYLAAIIPGAQTLLIIRMFRLLRVFRVLKLTRYHHASYYLIRSLQVSRHKIFVFLATVFTIVVIVGALMHLIEGPESGFKSIPISIYWAIVTITTVGYGDIAPVTALGQLVASMLMIMGYAIIAVPTGIITVGMAKEHRTNFDNTICCPSCAREGHEERSSFCKFCGHKL
jgi:voltage-gated potassium channel